MKKYYKQWRAVPYDTVTNIWSYQRRWLIFFWKTYGVGPIEKFEEAVDAAELAVYGRSE